MNTALEILLAQLAGDAGVSTPQSILGWRPPTG